MAAYMKTDMPFYGVSSPLRKPILRELCARFEPGSESEYRSRTNALWMLDHREEKYLALGYADRFKRFKTVAQTDLYEKLIREGAWWDFVDDIASHLVGDVVLTNRVAMRPTLERWIEDDDLWVRRTAILCQLGHKNETDAAMLFDFCLRRAHEREFFIRKAIGWALRQYAHTNPDAIRGFVDDHRDRLSGLSIREATKHL